MEADVERMKTSTVGQAYDMLYRQAATEKLRRETELLGIEEPEEPEQYEVFFDEYGRRMKRDVLTGEEFQVTGLPPAPSLTMEERLKLKKTPTDIARGDYWRTKKLVTSSGSTTVRSPRKVIHRECLVGKSRSVTFLERGLSLPRTKL